MPEPLHVAEAFLYLLGQVAAQLNFWLFCVTRMWSELANRSAEEESMVGFSCLPAEKETNNGNVFKTPTRGVGGQVAR